MPGSNEREFLLLGGVSVGDQLHTQTMAVTLKQGSMEPLALRPLPTQIGFADRFYYNQIFSLQTRLDLGDFAPMAHRLDATRSKLLIGRNGLHLLPGTRRDLERHGIISLDV